MVMVNEARPGTVIGTSPSPNAFVPGMLEGDPRVALDEAWRNTVTGLSGPEADSANNVGNFFDALFKVYEGRAIERTFPDGSHMTFVGIHDRTGMYTQGRLIRIVAPDGSARYQLMHIGAEEDMAFDVVPDSDGAMVGVIVHQKRGGAAISGLLPPSRAPGEPFKAAVIEVLGEYYERAHAFALLSPTVRSRADESAKIALSSGGSVFRVLTEGTEKDVNSYLEKFHRLPPAQTSRERDLRSMAQTAMEVAKAEAVGPRVLNWA